MKYSVYSKEMLLCESCTLLWRRRRRRQHSQWSNHVHPSVTCISFPLLKEDSNRQTIDHTTHLNFQIQPFNVENVNPLNLHTTIHNRFGPFLNGRSSNNEISLFWMAAIDKKKTKHNGGISLKKKNNAKDIIIIIITWVRSNLWGESSFVAWRSPSWSCDFCLELTVFFFKDDLIWMTEKKIWKCFLEFNRFLPRIMCQRNEPSQCHLTSEHSFLHSDTNRI